MKTLLNILSFFAMVVCSLPAAAVLNVFACEPEWASLAQELGGDKLSAVSATTALQDPHRIEGLGERAQDVFTRRQVSAAGRLLRAQEGPQGGQLRGYGGKRPRP
jgi:hypothetical protein